MITIYERMTPKEIANMLGKSINATNKAIQKMAKINSSWKIKENNRVLIEPDGVEWLVDVHFKAKEQNNIIRQSDLEIIKLESELEKYKTLYESQLEYIDQIKQVYEMQIHLALENQKAQLFLEYQDQYKHIFGNFYKKISK